MNDSARTCIVAGAGIIGSCCAWYLQQAGVRVTLVDPVEPGQSTSFGNAGCISPSGIVPFSYPGVIRQVPKWLLDPLGPLKIRWGHLPGIAPWLWRFWRSGTREGVDHMARAQFGLMQHVTSDWDTVLEGIGCPEMRESRGIIQLFDRAEDLERDRWQYDLKDRLGLDWRQLSAGEVADLEPSLRVGSGSAVMLPDWQHVVDPGGATRAIAEAALNAGAQWIQEPIRRVVASESSIDVTLESGRTMNSESLVVAAGAWSNNLVRQLDSPVPLAPKRGYHSMLRNPSVQLTHPVQSISRVFVMTPMADGLRVAGTAEFAALDAEPDYRRARVLVEHAKHYLPGLEWSEASEWMGQRPILPDSLPVIGRSPRRRNIVYAFGHGHWGLTQGPTTGRLVSELLTRESPSTDLTDYRPDRF